MKSKLVSIIIPAFNAEEKISKCIRSICGQSYDNLEIIIINDGSTDNTQKICEMLSKEDKRIKVLKTQNYGASHARNIGIVHSHGDYICFVDSDDTVNPNAVEVIVKSFSKLHSKIIISKASKSTTRIFKNKVFDSKDLPGLMLANNKISGYVWNKAYDRSLLYKGKQLTTKFDEDLKIHEDNIFNYRIVANNAPFTCAFIDKKIYNYSNNPKSVTINITSADAINALKAKNRQLTILKNKKYKNELLADIFIDAAKYVLMYGEHNMQDQVNKCIKNNKTDVNKLSMKRKILYTYYRHKLKSRGTI